MCGENDCRHLAAEVPHGEAYSHFIHVCTTSIVSISGTAVLLVKTTLRLKWEDVTLLSESLTCRFCSQRTLPSSQRTRKRQKHGHTVRTDLPIPLVKAGLDNLNRQIRPSAEDYYSLT
jgi:hypothetical protein